MTNRQNASVEQIQTWIVQSVGNSTAASTTSSHDAPPLQFVSYDSESQGSGPYPRKNAGVLKTIRSQAMRDHVWKENHPSLASNNGTRATANLGKYSNQIGRFRLRPKSAALSSKSRSEKQEKQNSISFSKRTDSALSNSILEELDLSVLLQRQDLYGPQVRVANRLNPFDITLLNLGPKSENLILHYYQAYTMNMVALDFPTDCLSNAITDLALLHAILYIVSTDLDIKRGISDSALSVHHGAEAMRLINKQLASGGGLPDTIVAAVAIIATRENLSGRFQVANIHMTGLRHMIAQRGGIQNIKAIHRRVATWSDFCDSNIRNRQPHFCPPPCAPRMLINYSSTTERNMLDPADGFETVSPVVPVIQELRDISKVMDPHSAGVLDNAFATQAVYDVEYDLAQLNEAKSETNRLETDLLPETVSLKIALHIYLYLMIRELPSTSPVLDEMARRLRLALEPQKHQWLLLRRGSQCWLLWMFFIGYASASELQNKQWFLQNCSLFCNVLNFFTREDLRFFLKSVMWNGIQCETHMDRLWQQFGRLRAVSLPERCSRGDSCLELASSSG